MKDTYIALQEAADFEGLKYHGMLTRLHRNPEKYKFKHQTRDSGGKD